jgi:DNA polymerase-1
MVWLVIDVSNLAYRAFFTTGDLSHEGVKTGVVFGIFRDVLNLQDRFSPTGTVFCFDGRPTERKKLFADYKSNRKRPDLTDEQRAAFDTLHDQLKRMRTKYLPYIGFRNVFSQCGYEADDLIASVCLESLDGEDRAVVVSTDEDLLQLLGDPRVVVWNPAKKRLIDGKAFREEHGIDPALWADVKALAGCPGDGVPGIKGVGERTAVKFLTGRLKETTKAYNEIVRNPEVYARNLELVRLPFEGTRRFVLKPDEVTKERWSKAFEKLGMSSLERRL